jgi:hypothetical protein
MAPPATTARRSTARPQPTGPRRPPLQVFEPAPRRKAASRPVRRSSMWVSGLLVVGSLLAVVVGDSMITQGQVRLTNTQSQVAAAITAQKALQVSVAGIAAPPVVVSEAERAGLVAPNQVVDLPQVPLNVPLPVPHTTGAPTPATTPAATTPATP